MSKKSKKVKEVIYKRLSEKSDQSKFVAFGDKVKTKELELSHYAIDNDVGYFYYRVL